jgi:hypothetical protein
MRDAAMRDARVVALVDAVYDVLQRLAAYNEALSFWANRDKHPEYVTAYPELGTVEDAWQGLLQRYDALQASIDAAEPLVKSFEPVLSAAHRGSTVSGPEAPGIEATCWPCWVLKCARSVMDPRRPGLFRALPLRSGPYIDHRKFGTMWDRLMNEMREAGRIQAGTKGKRRAKRDGRLTSSELTNVRRAVRSVGRTASPLMVSQKLDMRRQRLNFALRVLEDAGEYSGFSKRATKDVKAAVEKFRSR